MIAKIAVSAATYAIDKPYSYRVTQGMALEPGMRVSVPFGRSNKRTEGIVLFLENGNGDELKSVAERLDDAPILTDGMLRMAIMLRSRYFCTVYDALHAILPAGLWYRKQETFSLTDDRSWEGKTLRQEDGKRLLTHLTDLGGSGDGDALRAVVTDEDRFIKAIAYLRRNGWIVSDTSYSHRGGEKTEKVARLACSEDGAMAYAATRPKSALMQKAVLELLCSLEACSVKEICYFTGATAATVNRLAQLGYVTLSLRQVLRCREIVPAEITSPLTLTDEQNEVYEGLRRQMDGETPGGALLYGVTGSGKTSVYIRLIQDTISAGRQAILLVPEIALTPQLLGLMAAHFGDKIAVLHSSLPTGERFDQWNRVRKGEASVIVGTRSAVFAPCPNLGLLIMDEEQEHSYQSENTPRYHAGDVALWRGFREQALVLYGSATPSVETMYRAKTGALKLYTLKKRYNGKNLPLVEIIDMRKQMEMGNGTSISYPLQDALADNISAGRQSILFLNRRGNSRALVCVDCGKNQECPRCAERLTYHSANNRLMCHYCGYSEPVQEKCPHCGGRLKPVGIGTQKVQQELNVLFADTEVARMDTDTVNAVNTHEKILDHFQRDNVPILLGTQMVAKGLNLPNVTLVGVLDGDLGLFSTSYRAAETTFNMLTQVVGRAGRGDYPGRALIQTLTPEHTVLQLASRQDYDGFYEMEIAIRKMLLHPPFGDLVVITFIGQDEGRVLRGAAKFSGSIKKLSAVLPELLGNHTVLGPAPCAVPKINYNFRYRLTLKCKMNANIRSALEHLLRQFAADRENRGVSAFIDVNGYE